MPDQFLFGVEVVLNGLMAGVLYALVALGFVLIFKASGIFNYAQGVMALFAALTLVGVMEGQIPFAHLINAMFGTEIHHFGWHVPALLAIAVTMVVMVVLAWLVQRLVFRLFCSWPRSDWHISLKVSAILCGGPRSRRWMWVCHRAPVFG